MTHLWLNILLFCVMLRLHKSSQWMKTFPFHLLSLRLWQNEELLKCVAAFQKEMFCLIPGMSLVPCLLQDYNFKHNGFLDTFSKIILFFGSRNWVVHHFKIISSHKWLLQFNNLFYLYWSPACHVDVLKLMLSRKHLLEKYKRLQLE